MNKTFRFPSQRLSLDLLATVGGRGAGKNIEKLVASSDLALWLFEAGLGEAANTPVTADDLDTARQLREALNRLLRRKLHKEALDTNDIYLVNTIASAPTPIPVLSDGGGALRHIAVGSFVRACLSAIARDGLSMLTSGDESRLRTCANPVCNALFYDTSRPGNRKWCSMDEGGCGNRAKTTALRQRRRAP